MPRGSIFGDKPSAIIGRDYGVFHGAEPIQAVAIARLAREIQSLDYKTGPAIVVEDWDIDPAFRSTDPETLSPVRIGAMLTLLQHQGCIGDSTLHFQSRTIAKSAATNERLKAWGMYAGNDHINDAHRHAITSLRRARENPAYAASLWPYTG